MSFVPNDYRSARAQLQPVNPSHGHPHATPAWNFNRELEVICHPTTACPSCNDYVAHIIGASTAQDSTYIDAKLSRQSHFGVEWEREIDNLHRQNEELKRRITQLTRSSRRSSPERDNRGGEEFIYQDQEFNYRDLDRSRTPSTSRSSHRPSPYEGRSTAQGVRRVIDASHVDRDPAVISYRNNDNRGLPMPSPARREHPPQSTIPVPQDWPKQPEPMKEIAVSPRQILEMDEEDETEPGKSEADVKNVGNSAWGKCWEYVTQKKDMGVLPAPNDKHAAPLTEAHIRYIDKVANANKSRPVIKYLGEFRKTAQGVKQGYRTEAQDWSVKNYRKPAWADGYSYNPITGQLDLTDANTARQSKSRQKKAARGNQPPPYTVLNDDIVIAVAKDLNLFVDGNVDTRFGDPLLPRMNHHPEAWRLWYEHYRMKSIARTPAAWVGEGGAMEAIGTPIAPNLIRAHLRLVPILNYRGQSSKRQDQAAQHGFKEAMFLLATRGGYANILQHIGLDIQTYAKYDSPPLEWQDCESISSHQVAAHLAGSGFTTVEADDACSYARRWIQRSIENGTIISDADLDRAKQDSQGWSTNETGASPLDKVAIVWDEHHRRWALNSIEIRSLERERRPRARPNPSSSGESGASHLETPIKVYAPSSANAGVQEDQDMEGPPPQDRSGAPMSTNIVDSSMETS